MKFKVGKQKAFTLIELLVVISIIAILLAVLMPALSKVKEQGRKIVCGTRLKQIGLGLELYVSDCDGYYPPHRVVHDAGIENTNSLERLAPYLSIEWQQETLYDWYNKSYCDVKVADILLCPSEKKDHHYVGYNIATDYGINCAWRGQDYYDGGYGISLLFSLQEYLDGKNYSRRNSAVRRPAEVIFCADSYWDYIDYNWNHGQISIVTNEPIDSGHVQNINYRHSGKAGILFGDSHVETGRKPLSSDMLKIK